MDGPGKRKRVVIIVLLLCTMVLGGTSMLQQSELKRRSGGLGILDLRASYRVEEVSSFFTGLGQAGRASYSRFLYRDFAFILLFGLLQFLVLDFILQRTTQGGRWRNLRHLADVRGAFDALENIFILLLLSRYPVLSPAIAAAASLCTIAKWISMAAAMGVILYDSGILIWRKAYGKAD